MESLKINAFQAGKMPDERIIQRILKGEKELYEILLRRYNQTLYRAIRSYLSDAEVEDIMQEAYLIAYEKLHQFKGNASFSTWLIRIGINAALQLIRKKKKVKVIHLYENNACQNMVLNIPDTKNMNPEKRLINEEGRLLIEKTIDQLPEKYRVVYILREVEGMKNAEIAACLNISESNVKVRLHRARYLMKEKLYQNSTEIDVFRFGNSRCDDLVSNIMEQIPALVFVQ